jgi:Protein of unknown function (DUF2971)
MEREPASHHAAGAGCRLSGMLSSVCIFLWSDESMELPQHLYHYTSVEGVKGILESKSVWASLLHFMNDSQEWLYALDLMRAELRERITANPAPYWPLFITRLSESLNQIEKLNVYVFSLSAVSNQLSQWRAYCPPEGGYELRFNASLLLDHLHRHQFALRECYYDISLQRQLISKLVDDLLRGAGYLRDEDEVNLAVEGVKTRMFNYLAINAPLLKHPDFNEEKEWRAFKVAAFEDPHLSYHIKGSIVIPHYALGLETDSLKFPVEHVTVGPNAHQNLAIRGIMSLTFPAHVSIGQSTTPLRSL